MNNSHTAQFLACLNTLFEIPEGFDVPARHNSEVIAWHSAFVRAMSRSKSGYPIDNLYHTPVLENEITAIAKNCSGGKLFPRRQFQPTLCLTHDIDYLKPTKQLRLKTLVGNKRLLSRRKNDNYLHSIQKLLNSDQQVGGSPTVFIARPFRSRNLSQRIKQWVIDPSYSERDAEFSELIDIVRADQCDVGIHGSFYSVQAGMLQSERTSLEKVIQKPIVIGRQHWLNLPQNNFASTLFDSGIRIDSSLGWNGNVGFRGGFARPFPIIIGKHYLWEIPLLLMDGPMFNDLRLDTQGVVDLAIKLLNIVYDRQGCVAINWHDRAAHDDYGWYEAYQKILDWAVNKGFRFSTLIEAIKERGGHVTS